MGKISLYHLLEDDEFSGLTYSIVCSQVSDQNCTVFCSGSGSSDLIRKNFSQFGRILDLKMVNGTLDSYIRYEKKESAVTSIVHLSNFPTSCGTKLKAIWGDSSVFQAKDKR